MLLAGTLAWGKSRAQYQLARFLCHGLRHFQAVLRRVLAVRVRGDNSTNALKPVNDITHAVLQSMPLALVYLIAQHMALGMGLQGFKKVGILGAGSVIHHHNMGKAVVHQVIDIAAQLVIRVEGGDQNDRLRLKGQCFSPLRVIAANTPLRPRYHTTAGA